MQSDLISESKYKRVLLKISGEALMGDQGFGLHPPTVERIAAEIKTVHDLGVRYVLSLAAETFFVACRVRLREWSGLRQTIWVCWQQ